MEANPFATTLCIAVERLRMPRRAQKQLREQLRRLGESFWEHIADSMRTEIAGAGIDVTHVMVETETDQDQEKQQRYFRITGIQSDEAETVRALFQERFVVTDDDFDPTDYEEDDEEDAPWRESLEDE